MSQFILDYDSEGIKKEASEQPERIVRAEKSGKSEIAEKMEKIDRAEKSEKIRGKNVTINAEDDRHPPLSKSVSRPKSASASRSNSPNPQGRFRPVSSSVKRTDMDRKAPQNYGPLLGSGIGGPGSGSNEGEGDGGMGGGNGCGSGSSGGGGELPRTLRAVVAAGSSKVSEHLVLLSLVTVLIIIINCDLFINYHLLLLFFLVLK